MKLDANNLIVILQNLNIDIKGETTKRNVLRLIQKLIDGIEGEEHLTAIKEGFEKEFVADVAWFCYKENVQTSRVIGKVTDNETKGTVSGKSLYSLLGVLTMKEVLFTKTLKWEVLLVKRGKKTSLRT